MRWFVAAVLIATAAAYLPAIRAPFEFDDIASIPANPSLRSLAPSVALHPPANTSVAGRPVANYSLALNYALNRWLDVDQRPDPDGANKTVGYHALNLLLHLACGLLIFGIVRRTIHDTGAGGWTPAGADWFAAGVVGIWLLHPIQTEAVDYLVQRTELLVSLCYAATLYAAIRAWEATAPRARAAWRVAGITSCLVGVGSKEVIVTAPLIVILYDRAFRVSSWRDMLGDRGRVAFYALLFACSGLAIAVTAQNPRSDTVGFHLGMPWYRYAYSQAWAILHYVRLVVWPNALTFDYGQRAVDGLAGVPGLIVLGLFGAATLAAWTRPEQWGWFAFLGAWFFLLLAPSSSVVPITTEVAAERRIYLALASVIVLLGVGVRWIAHAANRDSEAEQPSFISRRPWIGTSALALLLVSLGLAAARRSLIYRSPEALWRDTVRKAPRNPRAYDNLAFNLFYDTPPRLTEAKELYWQAIALDSTYLHAWPGLATIAVDEGRPSDAVWFLEQALAINPNYADAVDHLGKLLLRMGKPAQAVPYLERFASAYPADTSLVPLGQAYMQLGRLGEATHAFEQALTDNPGRVDAAMDLGGILAEQGDATSAIAVLEPLVADEHSSPLAAGLLSLAYGRAGRAADAARTATAVRERAPSNVPALLLAGRALAYAGRSVEARDCLARVVQLAPNNPEAITELASVQATLGDSRDAVLLLRRALQIDPAYAPARAGLEKLTGR